MKVYEKPCISITCYSAVDNTNLKLEVSNAIATYNKDIAGAMGVNSFKLNK